MSEDDQIFTEAERLRILAFLSYCWRNPEPDDPIVAVATAVFANPPADATPLEAACLAAALWGFQHDYYVAQDNESIAMIKDGAAPR